MSRKRSYPHLAELLELLDEVDAPVAIEALAQALERVLQSSAMQDSVPDQADEALTLVQLLRQMSEHMDLSHDEPA